MVSKLWHMLNLLYVGLRANTASFFGHVQKCALSLFMFTGFVGVVGLDNFQRTRLIEKVYGREMDTIWFGVVSWAVCAVRVAYVCSIFGQSHMNFMLCCQNAVLLALCAVFYACLLLNIDVVDYGRWILCILCKPEG